MASTRPRRLVMLMVAVGAFVLMACEGDGKVRIVGVDGSEVTVTTGATTIPDSTQAPSAASPASEPIQSAGMPGSNPTPDTPTPEPTVTGALTDDLAGFPYSTSGIRSSILATGQTFDSAEDAPDEICPDTSVPAAVFSTATSEGADDGLIWALWVYPTVEEREGDWAFDDGSIEPRTDDCDLATGFNYFNANAVMAFLSWNGTEQRSPREDEAKEAFLTMGSAVSDSD